MWPSGQRTRPPCAVERDAVSGLGSRLSPGAYVRLPKNYYLPHSYNIEHGTDNKIVLRLSVRVCVCVSVCGHSHGRISSSIFTKLDTKV